MIEEKDTHPKRKLYYLGALLIERLNLEKSLNFDFFSLFQVLNKAEKVSINAYMLTLDWLFVLGLIETDESGLIKKCF
jgi:hypothetical protein